MIFSQYLLLGWARIVSEIELRRRRLAHIPMRIMSPKDVINRVVIIDLISLGMFCSFRESHQLIIH